MSELVERIAKSPITTMDARGKPYIISRRPPSLAQELKSKSRRDLVKSSLLSATCDSTAEENHEAALATFSDQLKTMRLEDRDDAGSPIGKEALLLRSPSNKKESSCQDNWLSMGCDSTIPSRAPISNDELAASKSKLKATSPTIRCNGTNLSDATPGGTPRKSIIDASRSKTPRTARKTLKTPDESPRTRGKSSSSHSKKKSMSSAGNGGTPVIKNRKKAASVTSVKRTRSKRSLTRNKSADDINWLKADPLDVSQSAWATLGFGPLVDPSSIGNYTNTGSSMDDTSSHNSGYEDSSWCKLSVSTGLNDSLHTKKTTVPTPKEKNRVKNIRPQEVG